MHARTTHQHSRFRNLGNVFVCVANLANHTCMYFFMLGMCFVFALNDTLQSNILSYGFVASERQRWVYVCVVLGNRHNGVCTPIHFDAVDEYGFWRKTSSAARLLCLTPYTQNPLLQPQASEAWTARSTYIYIYIFSCMGTAVFIFFLS